VSLKQGEIARKAHHKYGRDGGHKTKLNFGDCFACALAKDTGQPLLYKGSDFSQTDIEAALA
jgi:ribonuclease VapC